MYMVLCDMHSLKSPEINFCLCQILTHAQASNLPQRTQGTRQQLGMYVQVPGNGQPHCVFYALQRPCLRGMCIVLPKSCEILAQEHHRSTMLHNAGGGQHRTSHTCARTTAVPNCGAQPLPEPLSSGPDPNAICVQQQPGCGAMGKACCVKDGSNRTHASGYCHKGARCSDPDLTLHLTKDMLCEPAPQISRC